MLTDGSTAEIRSARPEDFDLVRAMHEAMSPDNAYLRFFSFSRRAAEAEAKRVCRTLEAGNVALLALVDNELAGVASYTGVGACPGQAEVAFAAIHDTP